MAWYEKQSIVIDNGTGYTKMGYSGNSEPSYIIPTAIASSDDGSADLNKGKDTGISDMDFLVGDAAVNSKTYNCNYPIRHGLIENWNNMERLWQRCIYEYLRCEPEEHYILLTEPPLNTPENREYTAEVMFETFNVPGMYIAVQAILALAASWTGRKGKGEAETTLTGTVVDAGAGGTHVIPVAEGYVIGSAIRHIPLGGKDISSFIQRMMRERGEGVPPEDAFEVAQRIKEEHCYVSQDLVKEFGKYDADPAKYFKKFVGRNPRTRAEYTADIGYERFLAAELFFNPEIYSADYTKPLSEVVDESILSCPIDTRKGLYRNIVLSGGSTMFTNFHRRLQGDIKDRVQARIDANLRKLRTAPTAAPDLKVKVVSHDMQRYAVWFGGSMLGCTPEFYRVCHTKAQYMEEGPRIARHNPVFQVSM